MSTVSFSHCYAPQLRSYWENGARFLGIEILPCLLMHAKSVFAQTNNRITGNTYEWEKLHCIKFYILTH